MRFSSIYRSLKYGVSCRQDYMATLLTTPATMEADSGLGEPTPSLWEGPAVKAESEEDESEGEMASSLAASSAPRPQSARGKLAWGAAAAVDGMDSTEAQGMKPRSVFSLSLSIALPRSRSEESSERREAARTDRAASKTDVTILSTALWSSATSLRRSISLPRCSEERRVWNTRKQADSEPWRLRGGLCRRRSLELERSMRGMEPTHKESKTENNAKDGFNRPVAGNMFDLRPATSQGPEGRDSLSPTVGSPKDASEIKEVRLSFGTSPPAPRVCTGCVCL